MYNYVFAVIYNWAIRKGKGQWLSKQHACNGVTFTLLTHLALILAIVKRYFGTKLDQFASMEKSSIIIGVVLFFIAVRLFYSKKRIQKIESKYIAREKLKKGGRLVLSLIFIPLVALIIIGWQS